LTYCSIEETSIGCASDCFYTEINSLQKICTNIPVPEFRSCDCSNCTEDVCGVTWNGLTYCELNNGKPPYPGLCQSGCYYHNAGDLDGICTNQLLGDTMACGNSTCPTTFCGYTTCDEVTETCTHTCINGCCLSLDSSSCQPCSSGGNLVRNSPTGISAITGLPIWALVVIAVLVVLLLLGIIGGALFAISTKSASSNYALMEKL